MLDPSTTPQAFTAGNAPGLIESDPREAISIEALLTRLQATAADGLDKGGVARVLAAYRPTLESLLPWITFRPDRYSRQRLFRSPAYEVILMCWNRGQKTPIHDHAGQSGWISVIAGSLHVQEYARKSGPASLNDVAPDPQGGVVPLPLEPTASVVVPAGATIAEAKAPESIHRVGPVNGRALSVHVYAGPVDTFLVFDEAQGTARRVRAMPDNDAEDLPRLA